MPWLAGLGVALGAICGCSSPPAALPSTPAAPTRLEPVRDPQLERFEAAQRLRAEQALRQGHWAEAELAYQALVLLRPEEAIHQAALARTRADREQALTRAVVRAQAAQARGDAPVAERAWLEALSIDPRHQGAAQALRELEIDRNRAAVVGRFAAAPGLPLNGGAAAPKARGAPRAASATPPAAPTSMPSPHQQRNALEHASLLAGQGELDSAIAMLVETAQASPAEPPPKVLLANLLLQRAIRQQAVDRISAIADLEQALKYNPGLESARLRLKQLKGDVRP